MDPEPKQQQQAPQSPWHTLATEVALEHVRSASTGLTTTEAARRLGEFGPNELEARKSVSAWHTFVAQFQNVLILILLGATIVSGFLGHTLEAVVITVIVLFAVLLGFIQEHRAGRALEALRKMAAPVGARAARWRGNGRPRARPGAGRRGGAPHRRPRARRRPRDSRRSTSRLMKPPLTGESAAVEKTTAAFDDARLPLGDRRNMTYAGTLVAYGRGQAVVVATGMSTEFGQHRPDGGDASKPAARRCRRTSIASARRSARPRSWWSRSSSSIGLARGLPAIEMFMFGIALAVAVVPEALPAVVTISLAIGVRRMVKRNALVRRLPIVETLGSTSVICSDKTGTLTKNEMTVRQLFADEQLLELSGAGYDPTGEMPRGRRARSSRPPVVRSCCCAPPCSRRMRGSSTRDGPLARWRATPPKARCSSRP